MFLSPEIEEQIKMCNASSPLRRRCGDKPGEEGRAVKDFLFGLGLRSRFRGLRESYEGLRGALLCPKVWERGGHVAWDEVAGRL